VKDVQALAVRAYGDAQRGAAPVGPAGNVS
jgi:hypothetical protein